jgi:hypothetical protein
MAPVDAPLQSTFTAVVFNTREEGWEIVALVLAVQLFVSVTVTVYAPAAIPIRSCVVALLLQL